MALLEIRDLVVTYNSQRGVVRAVDNVSLDVEPVQHLGIIGESGCGKTTLMRALVRVLPRNGNILSGEMRFMGQDLLKLSEREMRELRWKEIATIPQASMDSLDPVQRVGRQLETILRVRGGYDQSAARRRAVDLFDLVGLDADRLTHYPHEFSGGMKQRAVIAMALALEPSLLIADEPVTALDVIVQQQVLEVLQRLEEELKLTVLLITHDISVVAQVCDSVAVMYAGQVVEQAPAEPFFESPYHPYSLGLQNAFPNLAQPKDVLVSIEGYPPDEAVGSNHLAACLRAGEMETLRPQASEPQLWLTTEAAQRTQQNGSEQAKERASFASWQTVSVSGLGTAQVTSDADSLLSPADGALVEVRDLFKRYRIGGGLAGMMRGQPAQTVHAVNNVSFTLKRGESLGLAGESGCGKTTTGNLLVKLLEPNEGNIYFDGQDLSSLSGVELKAFRRRVQLMFQNPYEALNPRFTLYRSLSEPLIIHDWDRETERLERILETLEQVNLRPAEFFLDKYPHQISGGQLQRVVLARALVLRPDFLVADEPVSMLDVSVRAGILNTMRGLAADMGLTTVYISHDLSLLQYTCDRIAVMYLGQIAEIGPAQQLIESPQHPYTQALVTAVPVPDPSLPHSQPDIYEGVPRPTEIPKGCPFKDRCPQAMEACREVLPPWTEVGTQQYAACHLYGEHANSPKLPRTENIAP
jgi:peptide/nickel transport system ATP-binding protein